MAGYGEPTISDVPVDSISYESRLLPMLVPVSQPTDDDWNLPELPYLYSDKLHEEDVNIALNSSYRCLMQPVAMTTPERYYSDSARKSQKLSSQLWVLFFYLSAYSASRFQIRAIHLISFRAALLYNARMSCRC